MNVKPNYYYLFTWTDLVTLALTTRIFSSRGAMAETLDLVLHTWRLCQESLPSQSHTHRLNPGNCTKESTVWRIRRMNTATSIMHYPSTFSWGKIQLYRQSTANEHYVTELLATEWEICWTNCRESTSRTDNLPVTFRDQAVFLQSVGRGSYTHHQQLFS